MTETMGKRITRLRKSINLTQEQLAEKLGITAQAVSKWENDISCPDISILPKLAEILGVTCDTLLGTAPESKQYDETNTVNLSKHIHIEKGAIMFAVFVILMGAYLFICRLLNMDIAFWTFTLADVILCVGIGALISRISPFSLGLTGVGALLTLQCFNIINVGNIWKYVLPILLLLWGISMLIDEFFPSKNTKKNNSRTFNYEKTGKTQFQSEFNNGVYSFNLKFGSKHTLVECAEPLKHADIHTSFSDATIDFTHVKEIVDGAVINVDSNFSDTCLILPSNINAVFTKNEAFADINITGACNKFGSTVKINADAKFGDISITFAD